MNIFEIVTLSGILMALAAIPSSSVALVIARAATLGVANGVAVAIGIALGDVFFALLAILGMSMVAETLGGFFVVAKMLAGIYLVYLGIKLFQAKPVPLPITSKEKSKGLVTSLIAGFLLTLGDIKAIFFYASLFPIFVETTSIGIQEIALIAIITILSVGSVKVTYAIFASRIADVVNGHKLAKVTKRATGGVMIGAGSFLVLKA